MVAARRTGGRRWRPRSCPFFSPCVCRIALAASVSRAGACCQNPLRLGNTFDATGLRSSKMLPNHSKNLARRARMRPWGRLGTGFASKVLPSRGGFWHRRPPRKRERSRLPNRVGFLHGRRLRARWRPGREERAPDEQGFRPGPGRGSVSEAVSARPRRWRPGAGGRPGARRWREGPRPREARRARPRSWSRS